MASELFEWVDQYKTAIAVLLGIATTAGGSVAWLRKIRTDRISRFEQTFYDELQKARERIERLELEKTAAVRAELEAIARIAKLEANLALITGKIEAGEDIMSLLKKASHANNAAIAALAEHCRGAPFEMFFLERIAPYRYVFAAVSHGYCDNWGHSPSWWEGKTVEEVFGEEQARLFAQTNEAIMRDGGYKEPQEPVNTGAPSGQTGVWCGKKWSQLVDERQFLWGLRPEEREL